LNVSKKFPIIIFIIIVISSLIYAASKSESQMNMNDSFESTKIELNDFQISTCNAAHMGGTCFTKLPELNIVKTKDCCLVLGKCC
jgi:hypothetical protein